MKKQRRPSVEVVSEGLYETTYSFRGARSHRRRLVGVKRFAGDLTAGPVPFRLVLAVEAGNAPRVRTVGA